VGYGIIKVLLVEPHDPGFPRAQSMCYLLIIRTIVCQFLLHIVLFLSMNIRYMSSGRSPSEAFDDIWVLSLPQFLWRNVSPVFDLITALHVI
jgi:hypothetical protein